jgi:hypothetical protein
LPLGRVGRLVDGRGDLRHHRERNERLDGCEGDSELIRKRLSPVPCFLPAIFADYRVLRDSEGICHFTANANWRRQAGLCPRVVDSLEPLHHKIY